MATTKVTLTSSWQLVAAADKSFIADNASSYNVEVTFSDVASAEERSDYLQHWTEALEANGLSVVQV